MLVGEGRGGDKYKSNYQAKISPNYVAFIFTKEMKVKYVFTSLK
jgi:hypothetical protein